MDENNLRHFIWMPSPSTHLRGVAWGVENQPLLRLFHPASTPTHSYIRCTFSTIATPSRRSLPLCIYEFSINIFSCLGSESFWSVLLNEGNSQELFLEVAIRLQRTLFRSRFLLFRLTHEKILEGTCIPWRTSLPCSCVEMHEQKTRRCF